MTVNDILSYRLSSLQLASTRFKKPEQLLHWFGGMQAQDYTHCKWAMGIRLPGTTDAVIEKAIRDKKIIRTWLMRNTLHIAAAQDVHWLLTLLAPRLIKSAAPRYRRLELDEPVLKKTNALLARSLRDGQQLTRPEITAILEKTGIKATGMRLAHILQRAVLDKIICQGPKKGTEQTFILLDIPATPRTHEEALAELATRYFQSHGPATLADFTWWGRLSATDSKHALHLISGGLKSEVLDKHTYWMPAKMPTINAPSKSVFLLPGFDEYIVGYKNRSLFLDTTHTRKVITVNGLFNPVILIDGQVVGTWSRIFKKDKTLIELYPFKPLNRSNRNAIAEQAGLYGRFIGSTIEIK